MTSHQVFGFVPYWLMGQVSSADLSRLSTVAYFAVSVNGNGTFHQRGGGWADYQSSRLTALVKQAHAAGDRVVLTVNAFDQPTLDQLTQSPEAPYRLARAIAGALIAKSLDGVNLDFEGAGPGDRAGLVTLVTEVSQQLRTVDPGWQITMDTFGSSASDPSGFYDIKDLAPAVDAFFVMAYDMGRPHAVTPTAPLTGPDPNDTQVVGSYLSTVPSSKLLLGIPLYAYAYPTAGALPGARVTGGPVTLTEDQIETEAKQVFWDPATQVAWTAWRGGRQWYQTYFDDPQSVAAKVRLAGQSGLAGVGVWSLGMGNSPAIRNALTLGGATKDWTPSPEPPISTADSLLASLSPFPLADLSASDVSSTDLSGLSSAFADLNSLFGSDFGGLSSGGSDVGGLSSGGGVSGGLSSNQTGSQGTPGSGSPGTASTTSGASSSGTTAGGTTNSTGGGTTTTGASTTTTTLGTTTTTGGTTTTTGGSTTTTMAGGGSGGPSPGGTPPPSHLCEVIGALEQMGALPGPAPSQVQASAVATAMVATAPGCAQIPQRFAGPSTQLCALLAGVAEVATLEPTTQLAADALYQSAGCGTTVPSVPGAGQVAPSVQALACAVGTIAEQDSSPAVEQWGAWLSSTAACSPPQPLGSVPAALSPLVTQIIPQLAVALGDSTSGVCSIEHATGVIDPRCR